MPRTFAWSRVVSASSTQPSRRPVGRHDQEKAIHPSADDAAVLDGGQRRGVDDDVIVLASGLLEELAEARRLQHLVGAGRGVPRADDRQVERRPRLRDPVEREARVQDRADEVRAVGVPEAEELAERGPPEIGIDQEHAGLRAPGRAPPPG